MPRKASKTRKSPLIGIVMGSQSDWDTMQHVAHTLKIFGVSYEAAIVSAHRTPKRLFAYAASAAPRGLKAIIAGAGGAAHLPGMMASLTSLPVFGVPVPSKALDGLDSLLSIAQMPAGVPVGTLAIGKAGAINAGLLAIAVLSLFDKKLARKWQAWRAAQTASIGKTPKKSGSKR
jgi:5-(carboxyamino)imidazole ribonucleotide mutase